MKEIRSLDWEDVENKVSIICRKFDNIPEKYIEDLAQELRIHAYYVSDDYYDLHRKAIDYWRSLNSIKRSDVPFFDLELVGGFRYETSSVYLQEIEKEVKKELKRPGRSHFDNEMIKRAEVLFDIILDDIDEERRTGKSPINSHVNKYINGRLSLTWISETLGVSYRSAQNTMYYLGEVIIGLAAMGKIVLDDESLIDKLFK